MSSYLRITFILNFLYVFIPGLVLISIESMNSNTRYRSSVQPIIQSFIRFNRFCRQNIKLFVI